MWSKSSIWSVWKLSKLSLLYSTWTEQDQSKAEGLSALHLNISSLPGHIDNLKSFLSKLRIKFDTICISESKLSPKNPQTTNKNFAGYNIKQTPRESSPGGVLLYISQEVSYKPCKDLQVYCPKELESVLNLLFQTNQTSL